MLSLPNASDVDGELLMHVGVGRTVGMYGAQHLGEARALFLFRSERELDYHHRDVPRHDSITQLRMDTWSRGRVTLVGDAGYCPGAAVGGSTSLAVLGRTGTGQPHGRPERGQDPDPHVPPRRAGSGPGRPSHLRTAGGAESRASAPHDEEWAAVRLGAGGGLCADAGSRSRPAVDLSRFLSAWAQASGRGLRTGPSAYEAAGPPGAAPTAAANRMPTPRGCAGRPHGGAAARRRPRPGR